MNRRQRRTRGIEILQRLRTLKNSSLISQAGLKDIPQEVRDKLIAGTCENKALQHKYNTINKLLTEITELEIELHNMRVDLSGKLDAAKKNL